MDESHSRTMMEEYSHQEIDARFELLDRYERRCVIRYLQETEEGQAELADVISHLKKQDATPNDPDQIETSLQHVHLPKLASTAVLGIDTRSETVRYYGDELIEELLDVTPETHISGP